MFGGFKATFNLLGGKRKDESSELSSDMFVTGAYRINKEDLYGYSTQDPIRSRPSKQLSPPIRPAKSTSNLVLPKTTDPNLRKSTPAISSDPRGAELTDRNSVPNRKEIKNQKETKNQEKEQKKLEKQRLADQKKQAQEQAKREKLLKEQSKKEAKRAKSGKNVKKAQAAPIPPPLPTTQNQSNITPRNQPQAQPTSQTSNLAPQPAYSTNTLDSSISRSSGPPPYSEVPKSEPAKSSKDKSGNVVYSKPVDTGSWDIISQHREQISRPTTAASRDKGKQMVMDLNYNFGATNDNKQNSDA